MKTTAEALGPRRARQYLMHVLEPQDWLGSLLVAHLGPVRALEIIRAGSEPDYQECLGLLERYPEARAALENKSWSAARQRWASRTQDPVPERLEELLERQGCWLVTPEDQDWPLRLRGLDWKAPLGLWGRGDRTRLAAAQGPGVAFVGSRDATSYGTSVTSHLAGDLAAEGIGVLSGGAFGIDAAAHRAALATAVREPATVAFLACGIDRVYPQAHEGLLHQVQEAGLVLTELPPGASPMRHRFLQRNRLIAAMAQVVVVAEARWRSGALNTAHHALELGRPVAVVPGSVFSAQSAGCHRLLQEQPVSLVTSTSSLRDLLAAQATESPERLSDRDGAAARDGAVHGPPEEARSSGLPDLTQVQQLALDALPSGRPVAAEKLCQVAGLGIRQLLPALSSLEAQDLVRRCEDGRWVLKRKTAGR